MSHVFLSYSTKDHHFAELVRLKLDAAGIDLWTDKGQLLPGSNWRGEIDEAITVSKAVLVVLSASSAESSYVTYEWAFGMGKRRAIIPLKLGEYKVHAKLEPIQYLDFSIPGQLPWESLIESIREVESEEKKPPPAKPKAKKAAIKPEDSEYVREILAYLNQRGYQMASFERLQKRVSETLTEKRLLQIIESNSSVFRTATLADGRPGLAKLVP